MAPAVLPQKKTSLRELSPDPQGLLLFHNAKFSEKSADLRGLTFLTASVREGLFRGFPRLRFGFRFRYKLCSLNKAKALP